MENKIQKPITIKREEFKTQLADLINGSGMYAFVVESILSEFLAETRIAMQRQYQNDLNRYNNEIEKMKREEQD